ncbi:MAG: hypothetical protein KDK03_10680 [Rhodobacteraceae bacterium]|uniref:hypothetical protein n=1 Tax=Amaricoccus sp. B4 TaxID=3368557 RepID=UPI000DAD8B06|nr:hypothetical protein [Paracoccaceae bacterium]
MPAPIALSPLAWTALRYAAVAGVALYAARSRSPEPKDAVHERVLDDLPEGVRSHAHRAEAEQAVHGHGRLRRVLRFGRRGPGVEVDLAALGRMRFRKVD